MSVNAMTFNQVATVLASLVSQATGQSVITPTNTAEYVAVGQTALKTGLDPIYNALSQTLSRTIFSQRRYDAKFKGLEMSLPTYGNMIRKISIADQPVQDDQAFGWPVAHDTGHTSNPTGNGESVDMYKIRKSDFLQLNFYGKNVYSDYCTIFEYQMENALKNPDEMGSLLSLITGNVSDRLEQARETLARGIMGNFIGAVLDEGNTDRVVHLLSEYKTATGLSTLTEQDIYKPGNFKPFMQWCYGRVASLSAMMTERSQLFQTVVNNKPIMRHTPMADQRVMIYAPSRYQMEAMVLADTFHDNYLKQGKVETVNYWQSIETPDSISVKPVYTSTAGAVKTATNNVEQAGIFGVIYDRDLMGYAVTDSKMYATPINAAGAYHNLWYHLTCSCVMDNTEKGVVLLLD